MYRNSAAELHNNALLVLNQVSAISDTQLNELNVILRIDLQIYKGACTFCVTM